MLDLSLIVRNPEMIFWCPDEKVRTAFQKNTEGKIAKLIERLSDAEWLKQKEPETLWDLTTRLLCILPPDISMDLIEPFLMAVDPLLPKKPKQSPYITLLRGNRELMIRLATDSPNPPPWEEPKAKLAVLEMALRMNCEETLDLILSEKISLEEKSGRDGLCLLELVLRDGNLPVIAKTLRRVAEEKKDPAAYLRQFILDHSLWSPMMHKEKITLIAAACRKAGIEPTPLADLIE